MKYETFTKAPNYKSTEQDIKRIEKMKQIEAKKEQLKLQKELKDYYY